MRYTVVAVGKLKERFWRDACAEYTKRLGAYGKVEIREVADIDPARAGGVEASRSREGEEVLSAIPERSHVILLAIDGKQRSSEAFSEHLDELALRGKSDLTFVIGGSDGVSSDVRSPLALSPCRTTLRAWSCSSRSIVPARLAAESRIISNMLVYLRL